MKIDGRSAVGGTIVVAPGQKAEISVPFGTLRLIFNPSLPTAVRLEGNDRTIVFDGTDNPLGLASTIDVPLTNGTTAKLVLTLYSIGDGDGATRILHYTVS